MEEKSKIKHKPLLFIFTLALMLIIVHSIKAYISRAYPVVSGELIQKLA